MGRAMIVVSVFWLLSLTLYIGVCVCLSVLRIGDQMKFSIFYSM